jgi:hypothetical protein
MAEEIVSKLPKDFIKTLQELEKAAENQNESPFDSND